MVRMHARGRKQPAWVGPGESQSHAAACGARPGHDHLHHALRMSPFEDLIKIGSERFVGEVGADIDELHGHDRPKTHDYRWIGARCTNGINPLRLLFKVHNRFTPGLRVS